jgi:hypothetical protein
VFTTEYHGDTQLVRYPAANNANLLVLSQQYDVLWHADAYDGVAWHPTRIVSVNGVFMGVYLPAQSQAVRLTYHTYVQSMWLAHIVWGLDLAQSCYGRYGSGGVGYWVAILLSIH